MEACFAVGIAITAAIAFVVFAAFDGFGINFKKLGENGDPSARSGDD